jgi:hypothetical protein
MTLAMITRARTAATTTNVTQWAVKFFHRLWSHARIVVIVGIVVELRGCARTRGCVPCDGGRAMIKIGRGRHCAGIVRAYVSARVRDSNHGQATTWGFRG